MSPDNQSRLYLAAALAPGFLAMAGAIGSIADWLFSGPLDSCRSLEEIAQTPSLILTGVIVLTAARLSLMIGALAQREAARRRLRQACPAIRERQDGVRIAASEIPQAFVTGVLSPKIHVTTALLDRVGAEELRLILDHEEAHVRRRDPLRRALAAFGFVLHLPWVARSIERNLAQAQEVAADDHAATGARERLRLAELLVAFARMNLSVASGSFEFAQGNLEFRVRRLLAPRLSGWGPSTRLLKFAAVGLLAAAMANGKALHWTVQALTRLP